MTTSMRLRATVVLIGTVASLLASAPAHSVGVNFGGVLYDVSVVETTYNSSSSLFQLPPSGSMPWWGSQANADFFAGEVFAALGEGSTAGYGPLFAYDFNASLAEVTGTLQDLSASGSVIDGTPAASASVIYAIATAPVPGPLPWFGAAAALGWSRRLKRRLSHR
ncbi:MAG: hypothetical protein FJ083_06250 [Cyanobacteria bacterium K_Offshore_surface_m2_239]|nr:hypothetical protein [Cyanobacteria bacterium K_Offshore_surface_m2_239]